MNCNNKRSQDTCGTKMSSVCVVYEGYIPQWSGLKTPTNIEYTTEDLYKQVEDLKKYINTENPNSNVKSVNNVFPNNFGNITITTDNIQEGNNKYFSVQRSRESISSSIDGINYNQSSGVFTLSLGRIIPLEKDLSKVKSVNGMVGDVIISTSNIKWNKKEW